MEMIVYSDIMKRIAAHAKKLLKSEQLDFTIEAFLLAVCDYVSGKVCDDKEGMVDKLKTVVFSHSLSFAEIRRFASNHIKRKYDQIKIHADLEFTISVMNEAQTFASENSLSCIDPDCFLEIILTDEYIAKVKSFNDKSGASSIGRKELIAELTADVKEKRKKLSKIVIGQENAISAFISGYFQSELAHITGSANRRPRAVFLFAGPPGVGKTLLAENAAKVLGLPYMRFDMSEYSDKEANLEFCGSDKVYKGGKAGNITSFVASNPRCVLLFDEVEKAHLNVIYLFLQMLDAGRLRDNYTDEEVSFSDAIIILTTNAGRQLYEDSESADLSGYSRKVIIDALRKDRDPQTNIPYFPSALCSRLASGNIVMFNHIHGNDLFEIAKSEIDKQAKVIEAQTGIHISVDDLVYPALLFSEGGNVDARSISGRAKNFFHDELFEMFRLIDLKSVPEAVKNIESINFGVDFGKSQDKAAALFAQNENVNVLIFSDNVKVHSYAEKANFCNIVFAETPEKVKKVLKTAKIKCAFIDMSDIADNRNGYLNVEDIESSSRDVFWIIKEKCPDMPIYIIQSSKNGLSDEEKISFRELGVRNIFSVYNGSAFIDSLRFVCREVYLENSLSYLTQSNRIVTFETSQKLSADGKTVEIKLFDFELQTAVNAEDEDNILSSLSKPDVRFENVIGADSAKKELRYFIEYLKSPERYAELGVKSPKGVILYGPSGTGKTFLAKATAGESDVTFITAEGNEFIQRYKGSGAEKIHKLFAMARKYAPSIVFIDEIDAIAKERNGADDAEALNALLTEMDGFKANASKPVFVLAATNFDVVPGRAKSLDAALLRRFDRKIFVDLPSKENRAKFIKTRVDANKALRVTDDKIDSIAMRSTGMSLAELDLVIELSLRNAAREERSSVSNKMLDEAFEEYNSGDARKFDAESAERIARHEAGHAYVASVCGEKPSYVTIVSRGSYGGYVQHEENETKTVYTKFELLSKIRIALSGRAAEMVYYGDEDGISTGASSDLELATNLAKSYICKYGMSGNERLAVMNDTQAESAEVMKEINTLLEEEMSKAVEIVKQGKEKIDSMVKTLIADGYIDMSMKNILT